MRTKQTQLRLVKPGAWRVHAPGSPPNSPSRAGGVGSRGLACRVLNKLKDVVRGNNPDELPVHHHR